MILACTAEYLQSGNLKIIRSKDNFAPEGDTILASKLFPIKTVSFLYVWLQQ